MEKEPTVNLWVFNKRLEKEPTVDDLVECWLFNTPDGKHYGERWIGKVLKVEHDNKRPYLVTRPNYPNIEINIKEIWQVVPKESDHAN
jgi:hypothetical protein